LQMARSGRARALGVTSAARWSSVPEIPALAETVRDFEAMVWYGIVAPKGTPPDVVQTLNKAVTEAFSDKQSMARLAETGGEPLSMTPQRFEKFIDEDIERWRKVVEFAQAWVE